MRHLSVSLATDRASWEAFLVSQPYTPFLQSWTMGDVYQDIGQEAVRLEVRSSDRIVGVCFGHIVHARRGKHFSIPYGPVLTPMDREERNDALRQLITDITRIARDHGCAFVRMSPFWPIGGESGEDTTYESWMAQRRIGHQSVMPSPLHLLAEQLWILPLSGATEDSLLAAMRKTTRNLIRRAQKDGVTVSASKNPLDDLHHFISLHNETKNRHGFTPYSEAFFTAQVKRFNTEKACTLYLAHYQGEVVASSIHMHYGKETSYHHGASTQRVKVPASYLLQWNAITDAIARGDRTYNFWGIAPMTHGASGEWSLAKKNHPFAGVTLFKTGFGGQLLPLVHCMDLPLSPWYTLTRLLELVRKHRRGF